MSLKTKHIHFSMLIGNNLMEIIAGIIFIGLVAFILARKFKKASEGKDCCK